MYENVYFDLIRKQMGKKYNDLISKVTKCLQYKTLL